jgi:predicted esterase
MNASVTVKVYKNMGHTISQEEIEMANKVLEGNTIGT